MFVYIGMCIFAIFYFSRKFDKKYGKKKDTYYYTPPPKQEPTTNQVSTNVLPPQGPPPAPQVFVQVIVKDGKVVRVTTQTPNT